MWRRLLRAIGHEELINAPGFSNDFERFENRDRVDPLVASWMAQHTVDEVVAYCRHTLEVMMPGGGYCFAPTHQLQDNSPTENVVAMYATARTYGQYT